MDMLGSDDATYRLAGTATGYGEDFDRPGIVVSRTAREQVGPEILDWLATHSPR